MTFGFFSFSDGTYYYVEQLDFTLSRLQSRQRLVSVKHLH